VVGADEVEVLPLAGHSGAGSDIGDLTQVLPVVGVQTGGANPGAAPHAQDFYTRDHVRSAIAPATAMALLAVDLLHRGATNARRLVASRKRMSTSKFVAVRHGLECVETMAMEGVT
jgi:hypothetical protein